MNNATTITHTTAAITAALVALDELTEAHFALLLCCFQYEQADMRGLDTAGFRYSDQLLMEALYQANLVIADPYPGHYFNMAPSPIAHELFELVNAYGCAYGIEPREAFDGTSLRRIEQIPLFVEETLNY